MKHLIAWWIINQKSTKNRNENVEINALVFGCLIIVCLLVFFFYTFMDIML